VTAVAAGTARHDIRIGLWGATGSGKTTYLGALGLANADPNEAGATWAVRGDDPLSTNTLAEYSGILANKKQFPVATQGNTPLRWVLAGGRRPHAAGRRSAPPRQRTATRLEQIEYHLEMLDLSGLLLDDEIRLNPESLYPPEEENDLAFDLPDPSEQSGAEADVEEALRHLTDCQGILFLFDPLREEAEADAFRYFNTIRAQLEARTAASGRMFGPTLPHHVAVCITKFDDREVLNQALGAEGVAALHERRPPIRIESAVASRYLDMLARNPRSSARLVRDMLRARIRPERAKVFAMSSVGFWLGSDERFDQDDFSNVLLDGGNPTIRGTPRPMNVLEPMVWLASHIRRAELDGLPT
jgi:hypothetical protein